MRRHNERDVIILENEGPSTVGWFLLGAALGAGAALLLAPSSGAETRERLRRGARRVRDTAADALEELKDDVEDLKDRAVEKVDELKAAVRGSSGGDEDEDETDDAPKTRRRGGVTAAREELERRLADARARRRQPVTEDQEPVA